MPTVRYTVANGQIIAEKRTVRRFYQTDALGSVIGLFDSNQTKTDAATYWPYGGTRTSSGTFGSKMGFVGSWGCRKQIDGDIYMRARVQEPKDGRWLTVDPLWPGEAAYGYCWGSPVSFADPRGLDPCPSIVNTVRDSLVGQLWDMRYHKGLTAKVRRCIDRAAAGRSTNCGWFGGATADCLLNHFPKIVCRCDCPPNLSGYVESPPATTIDALLEPGSRTLTLCYNNLGAGSGPNYMLGLGNTTSEMIWITLLHEALHTCGWHHGRDRVTGSEPPGSRTCNEIAACCFYSIVVLHHDGSQCRKLPPRPA